MDHDANKRICQLIAGLVVVDDVLDDTEEAFVNAMLAHFGLSPEDRSVLFPIVNPEEARQELAKLPSDLREQAFAWLVQAAAADKRFADEERDYLNRVGAGMALSPTEIEERVTRAIGK